MKRAIFLAGMMLLMGMAQPLCAQDDTAQIQSLLDKVTPAIVTVKCVLKTQTSAGGQSRDSESRLEMQGVVVDKEGLVMVSNMPFSPARYMEMFGQAPEGVNIKATPTEIKVIFDQEEKEYTAFLAATDTKLDLAFIKIEDLGDRKVTSVDFSGTTSPTVGQRILSVSRLAKGFDYAPFYASARISGMIAKPRQAWMSDGSVGGLGLPVFSTTGEALGVVSTVTPGVKAESEGGFDLFLRMMSGASMVRTFIIPAPVVQNVINLAKQRAVSVAAERAKQKAHDANAKPAPKPASKEDKKKK